MSEFDHLFEIEQDENHRPIPLEAPAPKFKVTAPPSATDQLMQVITGESAADVQKAEHSGRSLQVVEALTQATDLGQLEHSARINRTSIQQEQVNILRKAIAEIPAPTPAPLPTKPGHSPSTRPAGTRPQPKSKRRQEIERLIQQTLPYFSQEALQSLVDAMESFVEAAVTA